MAESTAERSRINEAIDPLVKRVDLIGDRMLTLNDTVSHTVGRLEQLEANPMVEVQPAKPEYDKLYTALALAQGAIQSAVADKENTHFNFKYADLDACWDACRKPLSDNELAIIQIPSPGENGAVNMRTILCHSSGQSISSDYFMLPDKGGPQALGSCMTYLRRYMLCAMVGISQEDDDANAATKAPGEYDRISPKETEAILAEADTLFGAKADAVVKRMLGAVFSTSDVPIVNVSDIPSGQAEQAMNLLTNQHKREQDQEKEPEKDEKQKPPKKKAESDESE